MKLKDIEGLLPKDLKRFYPKSVEYESIDFRRGCSKILSELGEKELEIDVERVYRTMKQFSDYYGMADGNVRKIAQAIAREFPVRVKGGSDEEEGEKEKEILPKV